MTVSGDLPGSAAPTLGAGATSDALHSVRSDVGQDANAEMTGFALVLVAADGTVRSCNRAAELLLSCRAVDVVGQAVTTLEPEGQRGELARAIGRVRAGEDAVHCETAWGREGRRNVPVEVTVLALRWRSRRTVGLAVVLCEAGERYPVGHEPVRSLREHDQLKLASERERIGRDLHDMVIQRLFATGLALQGLANLVAPPEALRISAAVEELDLAIGDIRTAVFALAHHRARVSSSLRGRLLEVSAAAAGGLGHDPTLRMEGPVDTSVSGEVGDHLVAVLTEALSNVTRHAHASRTDVLVSVDGEIVLGVTDDGVGVGNPARSSGLHNMRQRAEALGGTMLITGVPAGGTALEWRVPLRS